MKSKTAISILVASALALTSMSSFAGQGKGGGASADRGQQVDRDRTYDRDRMQDRARTEAPEQDRDRDRTNIQDPSSIMDQDIYGNELMTGEERNQYRNELGSSDAQESRNQYQAQHEEKMQKRALEQGKDLVPPGQSPIYGGELMTVQERNEFREQLRLSDSEEERQQFLAQHRERVEERARALNLEIEEAG